MFSVLLDNIRSAYNVGSVFRTCDSASVDKLLLAGISCFPPHPKLFKTALSATESVSWEHHCNSVDVVKYFQSLGNEIVCFETTPNATSLFSHHYSINSCLVFGSETEGVNPEIIKLANVVVKIPQFGIKESLNVASAAAIGIYEYRRQIPKNPIT